MKLPGNAAAKLPGKGNQPFRIISTSNRSDADPIRNKSPTRRQNILQPNSMSLPKLLRGCKPQRQFEHRRRNRNSEQESSFCGAAGHAAGEAVSKKNRQILRKRGHPGANTRNNAENPKTNGPAITVEPDQIKLSPKSAKNPRC